MSTKDDYIARLAEAQTQHQVIREAGIAALHRLISVAMNRTGQSRIVGRFLLGLYNGPEYPFVLTDLRSLDTALFIDCLDVLRLDNQPECEVHEYFANGWAIWGELRKRWGEQH